MLVGGLLREYLPVQVDEIVEAKFALRTHRHLYEK